MIIPARTYKIILTCVVIAAVVIVFRIRGQRGEAPRNLPSRVDVDPALRVSFDEFDDALYLYVTFFAIGHDEWLASEGSMVSTSFELSGLPGKERAEELLDLLPGIKRKMGEGPLNIRLLESPKAEMMQTGVLLSPREGRVQLLQGRMYTQDGYGGIVTHLVGAASCAFTAEMHFSPGDYDDPGDLGNFWVRLAGSIDGENIIIQGTGGRLAARDQLEALLAAARLFRQISSARSYKFESSEDAQRVQRLAGKVASDVSGIDIRQTSDGYVVTDNTEDVGILLAFTRYGRKVLEMQ